MAKDSLDIARRVIRIEEQALNKLGKALDSTFDEAISLILGASGRVIVSGIGKSGHIARKIAATLASTGTPAHFVHPAEASHGDLGMMSRGDAALVLSNSGETPELANLVAYTRRFSIPLIGVASNAKSALLIQSDVALVLPEAVEACGSGIVPTSSTVMTLALGDALAIALMEHRAFTPENFRKFHPGGKLGARLSLVGDLMHIGAAIPIVKINTPMTDALLEMSQKGFGVVAVCDENGDFVGVITDGDLRRHMTGLLEQNAAQVMTKCPTTISPEVLAETAVATMNQRQITCLFVVDPSKPSKVAGLLHIHDCLRAGLEK
ncbi:MAG: KpsF/GutQ family sugar-phosphate isomerase [Aestuariivita sp.]|nr:KpsF/GutQ family sugar-phosphate isomerase [Aestuariivita sp.]MCY4201657.1 KpsF/GutQ family sugar-phosphate isomerase [Aestuariivita sp.]MCY4287923.1 KpsF/GutQ family sugar-phosphate isomerase [Aestuariivita sp.]MCY4348197.1 KpsF/GutQ family sugar-phosphate isomerase [Aestuariivita sp.]